jgi:hypothetical protein
MTESEFLHLALHSYKNIQCVSVEEFNSDLSRITGIKKLIDKLDSNPSYRLVLNNLVVLRNVLGEATTALVLHKIPYDQYRVLFPFMLFLDMLPLDIIDKYKIELDAKTIAALRKI